MTEEYQGFPLPPTPGRKPALRCIPLPSTSYWRGTNASGGRAYGSGGLGYALETSWLEWIVTIIAHHLCTHQSTCGGRRGTYLDTIDLGAEVGFRRPPTFSFPILSLAQTTCRRPTARRRPNLAPPRLAGPTAPPPPTRVP
jgi:hypothetical protein